MTENLIEVTVGGVSYKKRMEMFKWAKDMFGDDVEEHGDLPLLYFKNMADAEWFALRWS
jgi:hypothetical protein